MAVFIVLLVMLAGVLMIAGSMNTNIAQRTQFFGMLRCIGAGKDQIKRLVRREALRLCIGAIPVGVALGILVSWGVGGVLRFGIGGEWDYLPSFMVSGIGIAAGVLIGLATVLVASSKPAKKAAGVSPILAVSGNSMGSTRFKRAADTGFFKVDTALGIHHAKSSGRNLALMTGSFSLSIILFLSFSVIIDWIGFTLNTIQPYTAELSVSAPGYEALITKEQADRIAAIPEVKHAFGRMYEHAAASCEGKELSSVDLVSYDAQQFDWAKADLVEGDINAVINERYAVMTVFEKDNPLSLGDRIELHGKTLTVAAVLSDSPFSPDGVPILLCSEDTFTALTDSELYAVVDIQVIKNCPDEIMAKIRSLFDDSFRISDKRSELSDINNTYFAFVFVAYCFLGMIALISVFNIVNSISMSVTARLRQCGVMRAIGMDERQTTRMIAGEAFFYCLCGIAAGCAAGIPTNAFLYSRIITHYFGKAWSLPLTEFFAILAVVIFAGAISIRGPAKRVREMTVTETINSL